MASGSNNEDCQTSVRGTRDRRQFRNAVRAPLQFEATWDENASHFNVSDGYILDRVSISVIDLVDMGQSPGKRLSTGRPALVG
jgi:hypothetical protein